MVRLFLRAVISKTTMHLRTQKSCFISKERAFDDQSTKEDSANRKCLVQNVELFRRKRKSSIMHKCDGSYFLYCT